ncbi:hypothetical protein KFU94_58830 [Chloroflexi bacterium TSY]|nr:hypothetical protein [Chloroflexi bacterium TSY]
MTHFINEGHLNLYAYLHERFGEVVMQRPGVWAPYPYGFYALTSIWMELLDRAGAIDLSGWASIWKVPRPARSIFLFKLLYLPFDLAITLMLLRSLGRTASLLWVWAPAAIYTPFMMGQNDIYATTFTVAAVFAAQKAIQTITIPHPTSTRSGRRWMVQCALFLGIGATFKVYPLLLLPPLLLVMTTSWRMRLLLFCIGCSPFVLSVLPFLTTHTFIHGVLFNPEGIGLLRTIPLFGKSVSPFAVSYFILLGALISIDHTVRDLKDDKIVWCITLVVLALLFLWTPTPFYWLIWITPFLCAVVDQERRSWLPWLTMQMAFALTLFGQHRELGVALSLHLSPFFNMPNLLTTLDIAHPTIAHLVHQIWPAVNSLWVAGLLMAMWHGSARMIVGRTISSLKPVDLRKLILVPCIVMFGGLALNLLLARTFVSQNNWLTWQNYTLTAGGSIAQEVKPAMETISGVRLRLVEANGVGTLRTCLLHQSISDMPSLSCSRESTARQVENGFVYFPFLESVSISTGEIVQVEVTVETDQTNITLPYGEFRTESPTELIMNGQSINGSLDLSLLYVFNPLNAFQRSVHTKCINRFLPVLIIILTCTVVCIFGLVVSRKYAG